jgi:hypothetical protein
MSLLYFLFLDQTALGPSAKQVGCITMFVGILAQSGGFFVHMLVGRANEPSVGTSVTTAGAVLLVAAIGILIYGLVTARQSV